MRGSRNISIVTTHEDVDIAKNGNSLSEAIDLTTKAQDGIFSLQVEIESGSDSTSTTFTYQLSNDGVNFVTPGTASDIATAVDVSSGLDEIYTFEPELAKWMKIKVTENNTGSAGIVDCTCTLAIQ